MLYSLSFARAASRFVAHKAATQPRCLSGPMLYWPHAVLPPCCTGPPCSTAIILYCHTASCCHWAHAVLDPCCHWPPAALGRHQAQTPTCSQALRSLLSLTGFFVRLSAYSQPSMRCVALNTMLNPPRPSSFTCLNSELQVYKHTRNNSPNTITLYVQAYIIKQSSRTTLADPLPFCHAVYQLSFELSASPVCDPIHQHSHLSRDTVGQCRGFLLSKACGWSPSPPVLNGFLKDAGDMGRPGPPKRLGPRRPLEGTGGKLKVQPACDIEATDGGVVTSETPCVTVLLLTEATALQCSTNWALFASVCGELAHVATRALNIWPCITQGMPKSSGLNTAEAWVCWHACFPRGWLLVAAAPLFSRIGSW